ncbi:hypothetical protein CSB37_02300 [bacterium DOLZORAL124_38_8]|nr:MAG: hypothetical protein CSB37_02300 [bacterium DOLZORAL124_38_8]
MKKLLLQTLKSKLLGAGALLAASALVSKLFGLWRDRVFLEFFQADGQSDLIFAAFRIPDFFYFILIAGTVSAVVIPRVHQAKTKTDQYLFLNSFLLFLGVIFGLFCLFGALFPQYLTPLFAGGFEPQQQAVISHLSRYLFGSVFLLSFSSILIAFHQAHERFLTSALNPVLYMASVALGTKLLAPQMGLNAIGVAAVTGAALHLGSSIVYTKWSSAPTINWKKPVYLWKNLLSDFGYRLINGGAFQVNQSADVFIASFLIAGSLSSFSIGSALGHILLSIVGFSIGTIFFPKLSQTIHQPQKQKRIVLQGVSLALLLTVPFSLICAGFAPQIVELLYNPQPHILNMTSMVFFWTVLSLPMACLNPLLSKTFFANNQNHVPTITTVTSLLLATSTAAVLALQVFTGEQAVLGLAFGNFIANTLNACLLGFLLWRYYQKTNNKT